MRFNAVLILIIALLGNSRTYSTANAQSKPAIEPRNKVLAINVIDAIKSLGNQNKPPAIRGTIPDQTALFSETYDWKEQERVIKTIDALTEHIDTAWPSILDHVNDREYCITLQYDSEVYNHSVGDVCKIMLRDALVAPYAKHIMQLDEQTIRKLLYPKVISRTAIEKWCTERHKKGQELYALQIDMCEWALVTLDAINEARPQDIEAARNNVTEQMQDLKNSKRPVKVKSIFKLDSRVPYTSDDADRIRRVPCPLP